MSSAVSEQPRRPVRRYSEISDRQIAGAASRGRRVTFKYLGVQPAHEVTGYIVGMDDYHWMLASIVTDPVDDEPVAISLVHKSRADLITLHTQSTLDDEPPAAATVLADIGSSFWEYCRATYGRPIIPARSS